MAKKSAGYDGGADKPTKALTADDLLLDEIRTRFDYALKEWQDTRDEAQTDMRYVSGNPWSNIDRKARVDAGRPCLSLDELGQYFNQVINDVRSNPRAPQFSPTGMGANQQAAEFYGDKMREIEYRSQAQIAYTTAFQDCVHRSYGWVRLNTKFENDRSFNKDIWIEDVPNPDLVLPDPDATRPTSSDMRYLFYLTSYDRKEFKKDFPNATITDFSAAVMNLAPNWFQGERIWLAEYWKVETESKTLYLLQPPVMPGQPPPQPQAFFEDELEQMPEGASVITSRSVELSNVCMYLTNGVEILKKPGQKEKKVEWPGSTIPFISCFGMILYVNDGSGTKRRLLSMTRLARDPFMLYCYYRTAEAEQVGMSTKFPYFVRRGSLKPDQKVRLQESLHSPVAFIEVESTTDTMPPGTMPEFPVRNPFEPAIQALEIGAEGARRAIQAAMGVTFLPTQAQRHNEKSGVALKQIESSGQKGSFHFVDHYDAMIQEIGVKVEDLMDKVIDNARETGIRQANGTAKMVRVNDPTAEQPISTEGKYSVTVETGPATASTQQAATDFVDSLVANIEPIAQIAGPKVAAAILGLGVKLKNLGPLGKEIADIITPQEYKGDGQPAQIPPELQQQMQQMQQENAQLKEQADKNKTELVKTQMSSQVDAQVAQMQEQAETQRASMKMQADERSHALDNLVKLAVAEISAQATVAKTDAEQARTELGFGHEHVQNTVEDQHESVEAQRDREHELRLAAHDRAMQAADHVAAAQQQATDIASQPTEETD